MKLPTVCLALYKRQHTRHMLPGKTHSVNKIRFLAIQHIITSFPFRFSPDLGKMVINYIGVALLLVMIA